jgi:hypothetical protein
MLIDKAELIEDVQDRRDIFMYCEHELYEIIMDWIELYRANGLLCEDLVDTKFDPETLTIKFNEVHTIISEKEKLDNLKLRKDLGLNTMAELIKIDNPDLTDDEVNAKILALTEEKQKAMLEQQAMMGEADPNAEQPAGNPKENDSGMYVDDNNQMWKKNENGFEKVNA